MNQRHDSNIENGDVLEECFLYKNTKKSKTFKSLIEKYYMLKLTSNVSICVHFGHFVSSVGNVKYVVATFEYSLP